MKRCASTFRSRCWTGSTVGLALLLAAASVSAAPIHTTYLWHMHQPIYWPDRSTWNVTSYEHAYETITLGHSQNDEFTIFNSDDRVRDYQDYPKVAVGALWDLPDGGAQVSFAGSLIQNVQSLAQTGWNGGRYASNWYQPYRDAHGWTTSGGRTKMDMVVVAFHHSINPLVDDAVFRRMIEAQKSILSPTWGGSLSTGFFPAEMCFSERLIPILVEQGITWTIVPDVHIARACANYPWTANQDNCDPPNRADQVNPSQPFYYQQSISRGVTTKVPAPYGFRPHRAEYIDPATGGSSKIIVVPAANGMSWNEGYGLYGTGEINAISSYNDPAKPMLILFAHDGDNAWSGGFSYYNENVTQFSHAAAGAGYEPTTIAEYLADHPPDLADVVHVEDGGWVNADGDFGSPQFINWNWPLVSSSGSFDIPNGWAEDERNWAVLTAAVNRVLTAEQIAGAPVAARIVDPTLPGATNVDKAWHFLLAGHESGYMYYGTSLDMEVKPTLAANRAVAEADPVIGSGPDLTPPTVWLPQRLPWNPGGLGGGSLWGYPGGAGAVMSQDFKVWTFVHDVSGLNTVTLRYRIDADGVNSTASAHNETYAGGSEVGAWQSIAMTARAFPAGNVYNNPEINFFVMPTRIADEYWASVTGLSDQLADYYVEAVDTNGNVKKTAIQHVYVGTGGGSSSPAVTWDPPNPAAGGTLTIGYDPVAGGLPDATSPVYVHVGHSGWTQVVTPDPVMSFNAGENRWFYTYAIPASATSVDFVFNNGSGVWDNNGGADWHVTVSGGAPPPHVIDGILDPGLTPKAACGGYDLYAEYDGAFLYLAAPGVSQTANLDHFLLVAMPATTGTVAAPWAKAGSVAAFDRLLGNENDSGWSGWFNAAGAVTTTGVQQASGAVLEGLIDVEAALGSTPAAIKVAFAAYATANGGSLAGQAPCGNGNGDLEIAEWITVTAPASGVSDDPAHGAAPRVSILSGNPTRGAFRAAIDAASGDFLTVRLLDVRGRLVRKFHDGPARGVLTIVDPGADRGVPAGVYFLEVRSGARSTLTRITLLP